MARAVRLVTFALVAVLWQSGPARGAEAATVDEVLAVVADAIQERHERVAAATLHRKLRSRLCEGQLFLHEPATEARTPYLELRLGGARCPAGLGVCPDPEAARGCRRWDPACTADDVFVQSCRLLEQEEVPLADPHLLKSLTEDTVALLLRLSGARLPAEAYRTLGLPPFAGYVHRVMETLGAPGAELMELARPTLELADALAAGVPTALTAELGGRETTHRVLLQTRTATDEWIQQGCPFTLDGAKGSACPNPRASVWTPELLNTGVPVPETCKAWSAQPAREERARAYRALFEEPGAPFASARARRCSAAGLPEASLRGCQLARVTFELRELLSKLTCDAFDPEPRVTIRQLGAVLAQRAVYQEAVGGLELDELFTVVTELKLDDLPREELAAGVAVLARLLEAQHADRRATQEWAGTLMTELRRADPRAPDALEAVLESAPLDPARGPSSARVRALRDATRTFLTLPSLSLRQRGALVDSAVEARARLVGVLQQLLELDPSAEQLGRPVAALADLVLTLSRVTEQTRTTFDRVLAAHATPELEQEVETRRREGGAALMQAASALRATSAILQRASARDWVGLGVQVSEALIAGRSDESVRRQLRFPRVLLSMYQARDVGTARGIFHATLEDEASRERRYDAMTFEVGTLIAPRVGWQWNQRFEPTETSDGLIAGLFAPVGIQWARGPWGVMVYPLDLGAYVVVGPGEPGPQWHDALRAGAAAYGRPWRSLPIVFGAAADYRPLIDRTQEWRAFAFAALEVPLYLLH